MTSSTVSAPTRRTVVAACVGLALTALIVTTPYGVLGVHSPSAHLVLNSLDAFIALLVAFLVHGRFLRGHRLQDLLLSQGLFFLAVAGLGLTYVSQLSPGLRTGTLDVWLPLSIRFPAAVLIAAAALAGDRRQTPARRHLYPFVPLAVLLVMTAGSLWFYRSRLPVAFDLTGSEMSTTDHPLLTGHPVLLAAHAMAALCYGVAAVLFTVQGARSRDELLCWVGPALVLGAFARADYVIFPSLYTDWLHTGDVLRTGCHVLLLIGATREIKQYWHAQSDVAVLEDRRRLARELHDGVVQELVFIKSATYALPSPPDHRQPILAACDRALDEARATVYALGSDEEETLVDTLQRAVRQLADRHGLQVDFDVAAPVTVTSDQRHALVRIAREAVTNAVRHGHARRVSLTLSTNDDARSLVIRDDGSGFEVEGAARPGKGPTGYGLTSMRDRARGLPGSLRIRSAPGRGCEVAVEW